MQTKRLAFHIPLSDLKDELSNLNRNQEQHADDMINANQLIQELIKDKQRDDTNSEKLNEKMADLNNSIISLTNNIEK